MTKIKDVVAEVSTGRLAPSRVGFYIKRLAQEQATRRIATIFMVGLLLFQIFTFLAPPKPSYAASPGDLMSGAPFNKDSLISAVWDQNRDGIQQVFNRLGISRAKMEAAATAPCAAEGDHWISMGRDPFPGSGSVEWQQNIWVGDSVNRWGTQGNDGLCWNALRGLGDKIYVADGGPGIPAGWYEWGVLLDCGNIILKPTSPPIQPKEITCSNVNISATSVLVGQPVVVAGYGHGENISTGETVDMSYGAYQNGTLVKPLLNANGVGQEPPGSRNFVDNVGRSFTFDQPGTYDIALVVFYDVDGTKYFAANSGTGECKKTITVSPQPQPRSLECAQLFIDRTTAQVSSTLPFTPLLRGVARQVGESGPPVFPKTFTYIFLHEVPAGTPGSFPYQGKTYIEGNTTPGTGASSRINHTNNDSNVFTDPATGAGFSATAFTQKSAGNYLLILRVTDQNGTTAPENPTNCYVPFTLTVQPKDFTCVKLTADPTTSDRVPLPVSFEATASTLNTGIKQYQFDFGDGTTQNVDSTALTSPKVSHTYQNGGRYTAKVTVVGSENGITSSKPACTIPINITQHLFRKTVANTTILTSGGKPTDANGATARPGDKLTYTIGLANNSPAPITGYVFKDDISDIILYADVIDKGGAELKVEATKTLLVWPAVTIPVSQNPANPTYVTKSFTVQVKNPVPEYAQKPTDDKNYDCQMEDRFEGNVVITPISVNPAKRLECVVQKLPQTGGATSLIVLGLLAALSAFLLLKNRLLKRELHLLETLNEGVTK